MIHTIEDNFDYQVNQIFRSLKEDYLEENNGESYADWLWQERERVGEVFLTRVDEYMGLDETAENI